MRLSLAVTQPLGQSNVSGWRSRPKPSSATAGIPIRIGTAFGAAEHPVVVVGAGRWGCRSRSIWRNAASRWCCSMMPTGSARVAGDLLFQALA